MSPSAFVSDVPDLNNSTFLDERVENKTKKKKKGGGGGGGFWGSDFHRHTKISRSGRFSNCK